MGSRDIGVAEAFPAQRPLHPALGVLPCTYAAPTSERVLQPRPCFWNGVLRSSPSVRTLSPQFGPSSGLVHSGGGDLPASALLAPLLLPTVLIAGFPSCGGPHVGPSCPPGECPVSWPDLHSCSFSPTCPSQVCFSCWASGPGCTFSFPGELPSLPVPRTRDLEIAGVFRKPPGGSNT